MLERWPRTTSSGRPPTAPRSSPSGRSATTPSPSRRSNARVRALGRTPAIDASRDLASAGTPSRDGRVRRARPPHHRLTSASAPSPRRESRWRSGGRVRLLPRARRGAARPRCCGPSPGLDLQTSGRIEQGGRDISALPPASRDFGIVFQSYALFPNLTAAQNVALRAREPPAPRAEIASARRGAARPRRASPTTATSIPRSSPAASSSASRWPARWRPRRASSSSTSRCPRSTPRCACTCATRSSSSSAGSA